MVAQTPLNTSLDHLPELQQQELAKVVAIICSASEDILAVLLYGSYARGNWVDGPHEQGRGKLVGHKTSDYDILVVTRSEYTATNHDLWAKVKGQLTGISRAAINPIARDLDFINDKLIEGQYFFSEVISDAIALYTKPNTALEFESPKPLDLKREIEIAEKVMEDVFNEAKKFYEMFEVAASHDDKQKIAAFLLHQACEPSFKTILQIFGSEYPQEHYLDALSSMAQHYCPELKGILVDDSQVPKPVFDLLNYAYIGARYDKRYSITAEQLQMLAPRVKHLHKVVEGACSSKIAELKEVAGVS